MSIMNIICDNSIAFSSNRKYCKEQNIIWVGEVGKNYYWSYLYFDCDSMLSEINLISASLVLFKTEPGNECCSEKKNEVYYNSTQGNNFICEKESYKYSVGPSIDYVSKYSYCYSDVKICRDLLIKFEVNKDLGYVEIDVTKILKAWMNEEIENRGIMLQGYKESKFMQFEGVFIADKWVRPFLKIKYIKKGCIYPETHEPIVNLPINIRIKK